MRDGHGSSAHLQAPVTHLRLVRGASVTTPSLDGLADAYPTSASLRLLDLTMAKLEHAVAAFEKERHEFEKWANDERAAIASERAGRRRWFR